MAMLLINSNSLPYQWGNIIYVHVLRGRLPQGVEFRRLDDEIQRVQIHPYVRDAGGGGKQKGET